MHARGNNKRTSTASAEDTYTIISIVNNVRRMNIIREIMEYATSMLSS
jgi:hypothetical protein